MILMSSLITRRTTRRKEREWKKDHKRIIIVGEPW